MCGFSGPPCKYWPVIFKRKCTGCLCLDRCIPLLIQQNVNGSIPFFNRSWEEFKVGFNDSRGNYWLGNELLHQLTVTGLYKLRFDLQSRASLNWLYAEYSTFLVLSEEGNYVLRVSGYSGNAGDALSPQNGMMFTTYDRDNDQWSNNCAMLYGGGFWYSSCSDCKVNGHRRYSTFKWFSTLLQTSRMWLTCR